MLEDTAYIYIIYYVCVCKCILCTYDIIGETIGKVAHVEVVEEEEEEVEERGG